MVFGVYEDDETIQRLKKIAGDREWLVEKAMVEAAPNKEVPSVAELAIWILNWRIREGEDRSGVLKQARNKWLELESGENHEQD